MVPSAVISLCALAGGQAPAEAPPLPATVGRFSGRSALVVEGARAYAAGEIVRALAVFPRFIVVSHPRAPLEEYLRHLEENVRLGYLRGGFPDAVVKAVVDHERGIIRIVIDEGRRLVAGPVIVEGARALPVETIAGAVTECDPEDEHGARWEPGEPAKLDPLFLERAARLVERAYARAGHLSARIEAAAPAGEADAVSLVVRVMEEGSPSTVGEVLFQGTFTDDLETVARTVGIRSGMALDRGTLDGFMTKLEGLGRYLHIDVKTVPSGTSGRIDLHVNLLQAEFAPPLGEPEPEERAVLRRGLRWLGDTSRWKGPLVLRADAAGVIHRLGLDPWLEGAACEVAVAPDGLLIQARYRRAGRDVDETVGLVVAGNKGLLVAAPLALVSRFDLTGGPSLVAHAAMQPAEPGATGDKPFKLVAGVALKGSGYGEPRFRLDLDAPEVALAYLSRSGSLEYRFDGDLVHVDQTRDGEAARIASVHRETGAVGFRFQQERGGFALSLSFEESGLAGRLEAADGEALRLGYKEASPMRFLALSGVGAARLARFVRGERDGAQLRCLEAVLGRLLESEAKASAYLGEILAGGAPAEKGGRETFRVPHSDPQSDPGWGGLLFGLLASRLAADMPRDSWLQALFREAACIGSGESLYTADELKRLFGSSEVGPIGCWALAEVLAFLGRSAQAGMFAEAALRQCSLAGFRTELRVLRQESSLPARIIAALGRSLQELDEAAVASVGADAERLGDDDEREFVRLFDAARRIEDPAEAGASLLEAFWVAGLDDLVRSRCEALAP